MGTNSETGGGGGIYSRVYLRVVLSLVYTTGCPKSGYTSGRLKGGFIHPGIPSGRLKGEVYTPWDTLREAKRRRFTPLGYPSGRLKKEVYTPWDTLREAKEGGLHPWDTPQGG